MLDLIHKCKLTPNDDSITMLPTITSHFDEIKLYRPYTDKFSSTILIDGDKEPNLRSGDTWANVAIKAHMLFEDILTSTQFYISE